MTMYGAERGIRRLIIEICTWTCILFHQMSIWMEWCTERNGVLKEWSYTGYVRNGAERRKKEWFGNIFQCLYYIGGWQCTERNGVLKEWLYTSLHERAYYFIISLSIMPFTIHDSVRNRAERRKKEWFGNIFQCLYYIGGWQCTERNGVSEDS